MVVVFLVDGSIVLKGNASYETNSIVLVLPVYIISGLKFNWNVHILVKLKGETDKKPDGQGAGPVKCYEEKNATNIVTASIL